MLYPHNYGYHHDRTAGNCEILQVAEDYVRTVRTFQAIKSDWNDDITNLIALLTPIKIL